MLRDVSTAWASQRLAGCFNLSKYNQQGFYKQIFNCTWKEIISQLCTDVGGKCAMAKLIHQELLDGHLEGSVGRVEAFQPLNSSIFEF